MYVILIAIPAFCVMFVVMANIPYKIRINFKPFTCELCLAFWVSFMYLIIENHPWFTATIFAGASAYLTGPLKRIL